MTITTLAAPEVLIRGLPDGPLDIARVDEPLKLIARVNLEGVSYQWILEGPGRLQGDPNGRKVFYVPPDEVSDRDIQVNIIVIVTDDRGNSARKQAGIQFASATETLLLDTPTPEMPQRVRVVLELPEFFNAIPDVPRRVHLPGCEPLAKVGTQYVTTCAPPLEEPPTVRIDGFLGPDDTRDIPVTIVRAERGAAWLMVRPENLLGRFALALPEQGGLPYQFSISNGIADIPAGGTIERFTLIMAAELPIKLPFQAVGVEDDACRFIETLSLESILNREPVRLSPPCVKNSVVLSEETPFPQDISGCVHTLYHEAERSIECIRLKTRDMHIRWGPEVPLPPETLTASQLNHLQEFHIHSVPPRQYQVAVDMERSDVSFHANTKFILFKTREACETADLSTIKSNLTLYTAATVGTLQAFDTDWAVVAKGTERISKCAQGRLQQGKVEFTLNTRKDAK